MRWKQRFSRYPVRDRQPSHQNHIQPKISFTNHFFLVNSKSNSVHKRSDCSFFPLPHTALPANLWASLTFNMASEDFVVRFILLSSSHHCLERRILFVVKGMEIHRSSRRMVAGDRTCSQMGSAAQDKVPHGSQGGRWRNRHRARRPKHARRRRDSRRPSTHCEPRRPRGRRHQEIVEEGTRGCARTPNPSRSTKRLQVASGMRRQSFFRSRASSEIGGTTSSNTSHTSGEFSRW